MDRTFKIVLAAVVLALLPATAFAQGSSSSDTMPELRLRGMPASLTACMRQCAAGHTPDATCRPKTSSAAMRSLRAIKGRMASLQRQINGHEHRIAALEAEVNDTGRTDALQSQIDGQKHELETLSLEVKQLYRFYHFVVEDYVNLAVRVGVNEDKIKALQLEVGDLSSRVAKLESRPGTVGLGVRIGGLVLSAPGKRLSFSSFLVGPRFSLRLSKDQTVSVDAQALVAASDHPFGVRSRLGYQLQLRPQLQLDMGLSGTWASLDDSLHAASAFIGPDAGLTWKPTPWLNVGGNLFMGAALTSSSSAFAVGGIGTVGLDLPF